MWSHHYYSLHQEHSGHFSVALWSADLLPLFFFFGLALKNYFKCSGYGAKHWSCLGTGEPMKCTFT